MLWIRERWEALPVGTKSVLVGAHCFFLHPFFVAWAWKRLYGWPLDPRLWVAFFVHDLGYVGSPNMDGPEGERHVEWGAALMRRLFGDEWGDFCRYHSRYYAKQAGAQFSRLCVADKLSFALTPRWLYLPMVRLSGELDEYMELARQRVTRGEPRFETSYTRMGFSVSDQTSWWESVAEYMRRWVDEHKDGGCDTWTPVVVRKGDK